MGGVGKVAGHEPLSAPLSASGIRSGRLPPPPTPRPLRRAGEEGGRKFCGPGPLGPPIRGIRKGPGPVPPPDDPEPIPDAEIEALKALRASKLPYDANPYLREGMVVEVRRGPLEGVRGILLRKAKRHRLVISVHLIQQAAAVEIDASNIMPI